MDLRGNRLGEEGVHAIGRSLLQSTGGRLGFLMCDALSVDEGVDSLDFSRCGITAVRVALLAGVLKTNSTLRRLDLHRQLDVESCRGLARALDFNTSLVGLNLDGCELNLHELRGADGVVSIDLSSQSLSVASGIIIAKLLASNSVLTDLHLQYNMRLGRESALALAHALEANSSLTRLDVRGAQLGREGMAAIGEGLLRSGCTRLALLACDAFAIERGDLSCVADGLTTSSATLLAGVLRTNEDVALAVLDGRELDIRRLKHQPDADRPGVHSLSFADEGLPLPTAVLIARLLERNTYLHEVNLRGNQLGVKGGVAVAKMLTRNGTLRTLKLAGNALCGVRLDEGVYDPAALDALGAALQANGALTKLNLAATQGDFSSGVGAEGMATVAKALLSNKVLAELSFQFNANVGAEGISALSAALHKNRALTSLNLAGVRLGPSGGYTSLCQTLSARSSITTLNVSSNALGPKGAAAFAATLEVNWRLLNLSMDSNSLGVEGGHALARSLAQNASLRQLDVRSNGLGEAKAELRAVVEGRTRSTLVLQL